MKTHKKIQNFLLFQELIHEINLFALKFFKNLKNGQIVIFSVLNNNFSYI